MPKPKLHVVTHGVSKCEVRVHFYKCPTECKTVSKSQKELNTHVNVKHPNFCFKCKHCGAEYKICNANYVRLLFYLLFIFNKLSQQYDIVVQVFKWMRHSLCKFLFHEIKGFNVRI